MPVSASLLDDAKNYLDITYADDAIDKKLRGILERGMSYLNEAAGAELGYGLEGRPRSLLFDYARYARSNALDEFMSNYLPELLALQIHTEVKGYGGVSDDQGA